MFFLEAFFALGTAVPTRCTAVPSSCGTGRTPMGNNPLRAILAELVDFERLTQAPIKLFITATNVRTGRGHVFKNNAITPDVLLASACLPTMFQAIDRTLTD
jgi:predicted acylesterase/phospholipase RssA